MNDNRTYVVVRTDMDDHSYNELVTGDEKKAKRIAFKKGNGVSLGSRYSVEIWEAEEEIETWHPPVMPKKPELPRSYRVEMRNYEKALEKFKTESTALEMELGPE